MQEANCAIGVISLSPKAVALPINFFSSSSLRYPTSTHVVNLSRVAAERVRQLGYRLLSSPLPLVLPVAMMRVIGLNLISLAFWPLSSLASSTNLVLCSKMSCITYKLSGLAQSSSSQRRTYPLGIVCSKMPGLNWDLVPPLPSEIREVVPINS